MCLPGQPPALPQTAAQAAAMATAALGWLAAADPAALTSGEQADCLRGLERAASMHTAARARVLAGFCAGGGYEGDGHGSAKSWLRWQTRVTPGAAAGAMGWMRRLSAHPAVRVALAGGGVCRSHGRGRSVSGRTCCRGGTAPTPARSCWARRRAGRSWPTWAPWLTRCAAGWRRRIPMMTGLMTGGCGWSRLSAAPGNWTGT
jgi:hypothetical protein